MSEIKGVLRKCHFAPCYILGSGHHRRSGMPVAKNKVTNLIEMHVCSYIIKLVIHLSEKKLQNIATF